MKKSLLLTAVACVAMAANAQTESAFLDAEALGIGSSNTAVTAGTVLATSANVTMKAAYDCEYKTVAMNGESDAFKAITIDAVEYGNLVTGIQGQSNPSNTKNALTQQPKDNAIFQFDVKADGMLYVFSKLSGNKQYYAFEGAYTSETPSSAIAYTIICGSQTDGNVYTGALAGSVDGYADFTGYAAAETIGAPFLCELVGLRTADDENYGTNSGFTDAQKATLLGVAAFPVYAEAGTYYFHAVGSKVTCNGFVFIPGATSVATVSVSAGDTSISSVKANSTKVAYNILGQRVAADAKGLVIVNGKKQINK